MKLTAFLAALLLGTTAMAQSASAPAAPAWTFALHGFVSMSAAYQTGAFGLSEGQQSLNSATGASPVPDKSSLTFDVRQSRFNFSVKGPQVLGGATPSGVLEIDFFQGFGGGNYGDVSLLNRMRLAYSELNWGPAARIQAGQQNDLVFAMAPTSLSHIAFPLGYFTGNIGWRRPGVFGFHSFTVAPDAKVEFAWEVGRAQWADQASGGSPGVSIGGAAANEPGGINYGEASSAPAVEGRLSLAYAKYLNAFVAAHWNNNDLTGYGSGATGGTNNALTGANAKHTVATYAYNAGLKVTLPLPSDMGLTLQGTGFTGLNVQPLIADFTTGSIGPAGPGATGTFTTPFPQPTFRVGPAGEGVQTTGWWAQAGFNFTKEFSLWAFYGNQFMDHRDFVRAGFGTGAYDNTTTNVMLMYRDGGYGISAEWIDFSTKYALTSAGGTIATHRTSTADQYMVTANYFF